MGVDAKDVSMARAFDISLIDHVIVCDDRFFSFSDDRVYVANRPA